MANPLYLCIASFGLFMLILYSWKVSDALRFYIREKKNETKNTEAGLNKMVTKLRDHVRFLRLQVNSYNKNKTKIE
jgi:hypothetical protein